MQRAITNYQFFSIQSSKTSVALLHRGEEITRIALRKIQRPVLKCQTNYKEIIPVLSSHLMGQPKITQIYQALNIRPVLKELETDGYMRYLLHYSLEYSLNDQRIIVDLPDIALIRRAYIECPSEVNSNQKKDFILWLAWLKFRFHQQLKSKDLQSFVSLLPYFQGRGYDYFRELATITTATYKDKSLPALVELAIWFKDLSQKLVPLERDKVLEKIVLERDLPFENKNQYSQFLEKTCRYMREQNWGGYVLSNIYDKNAILPSINFPINSISIILSHCMIGLGDMSLFVALIKAFKLRYPDKNFAYYIFQEKDKTKFDILWPKAGNLENKLHYGLSSDIRSQIESSDLAVYVTTPWSYQNGINAVLDGPKAKVTIYLPGLDWNRTQGFLRSYPNGQIEMMFPIGLSPYALANPLEIFSPGGLKTKRTALPMGIKEILSKFSNYPKGILYTSYDSTILKGAIHFLRQMQKKHDKFIYFTFIRRDDFSSKLLNEFATTCRKYGIHFCDTKHLPSKRYLIMDLGPLSQEEFNAIVKQCELPSLVTGTASIYQFLGREKLFFHLGNHPNSRILKLEIENSLFAAYKSGVLSFQEYQLLIEYFNLFKYRYQNPKKPFILDEFDIAHFTTTDFIKGYHKWLSFLKSSQFSFFNHLENLLPLAKKQDNSSFILTKNGAPTFETVYDDEATTIWNDFRYGIFYLNLSPEQALARTLEKFTLEEVKQACEKLRENPYRKKYNDMLAEALISFRKQNNT